LDYRTGEAELLMFLSQRCTSSDIYDQAGNKIQQQELCNSMINCHMYMRSLPCVNILTLLTSLTHNTKQSKIINQYTTVKYGC